MSKRDHHPSSERFIPALWKQRRSFILDTLSRFQVESVLDYGCGEASVLSFLTCPELKFRRLAGIDIDPGVLEEAIGECMPIQSDYAFPRSDSLHVDIYQGSIGVADDRFTTYDAIVCSEVIEHVYASVLDSFLDLTLGTYGPALMIVTTPNSEYNVHFPDLKYGTLHATFRHDDHKFEWTRKEFEAWCLEGANKYGYQTEFHGIGLLDDDTSHGHCTQACLFIRPYARHSTPSLGQRHQLLKHIEFPFDYQRNQTLYPDLM
ncbi:uncharacterized protein B0P05DRAFT_572513 [Gilbertella persicaria]|uniref:uncharacterized protein n=1 Tax=Gilbertella persicaria TaxID=101096 RepID=UPI00221E8D39|nr:uncharacterized protein B0P05DRAFT_572513 [Gilbertella persicaria]KAI8076550.1 hypothetical protein B0P05DRAFT_572513 [Gilbertella persicaria]